MRLFSCYTVVVAVIAATVLLHVWVSTRTVRLLSALAGRIDMADVVHIGGSGIG